MDRKEFIKTCGWGCIGLTAASFLLESCAGTQYINAQLAGSYLTVPLNVFEITGKEKVKRRRYVVVQHEQLQYPICVYRFSGTEYKALLMKCTHQGTELHVYGDRLQCPAHGSEFTNTGAVQNGPADTSLRIFPIQIENDLLKIDLT